MSAKYETMTSRTVGKKGGGQTEMRADIKKLRSNRKKERERPEITSMGTARHKNGSGDGIRKREERVGGGAG